VESTMDGDGLRETGIVTIALTVFEAGDTVPEYARPLSEVLQQHTDPETGLLTLPGGSSPRATMDPAVLRDAAPTAMASLGVRFRPTGPATESPTCALPHPQACDLPDSPAT
jgi:hypothetical protein